MNLSSSWKTARSDLEYTRSLLLKRWCDQGLKKQKQKKKTSKEITGIPGDKRENAENEATEERTVCFWGKITHLTSETE